MTTHQFRLGSGETDEVRRGTKTKAGLEALAHSAKALADNCDCARIKGILEGEALLFYQLSTEIKEAGITRHLCR